MDFGGKSVILFISSGVQERASRSFFIFWYNRECKDVLRDFGGNEMEVEVKKGKG